jgi:hypothetical protein
MGADVQSDSGGNSRRAVLAGALGGIGAWAASAIGRASPVRGADGDPVLVGALNSGAGDTRISTTGDAGLVGISTNDDGTGLIGWANHPTGSTTGVMGEAWAPAGFGVTGHAWAETGNATGVWGTTSSSAGRGVLGVALHNRGTTYGVVGQSLSRAGIGVLGEATATGVALQAAGRVKFSTSGVATIAAGRTSITVTPGVEVTSRSFVLLSPKVNLGARGMWFTVSATTGRFTIRMNTSRSSGTPVAWLLVG